MIEVNQIVLALFWVSLMLIFLLGDVLRIFSGNFVPGEIDGEPVRESMWTFIALVMVVPILMVMLSLLIPISVSRWISIVVSVLFFLMNIAGIKGYKLFDQILLVISFGINFFTIYYAWSL